MFGHAVGFLCTKQQWGGTFEPLADGGQLYQVPGADLETVRHNVNEREHGSLKRSFVTQAESDGDNNYPDERCVESTHTGWSIVAASFEDVQ